MLGVLTCMAGGIYVLHTLAKCLVTVEQQRHVVFNDFFLEFILFWFWIVGIWILQPRINEIFKTPVETEAGAGPPPILG